MRRQNGSAILAVMLLIMIAAMMFQMSHLEQQKRDHAVQAISWSKALQQVCQSADTYATRNWSAVSAQPTTSLTMANLIGVPPLTSDAVATLNGIAVNAQVIMTPAGCDAAANQCRTDVRVWTGALPGTAAQRSSLANAVVKRVGDLASQSLPEDPSLFVARNVSRTDPNPTGISGAVMVRCGEVNLPTTDTGLRGNVQMTGALNAGGNDLKMPDLDAGGVQINEISGAACTELNRVALDASGRYMYCDGSVWKSAALPVTQIQTENFYQ